MVALAATALLLAASLMGAASAETQTSVSLLCGKASSVLEMCSPALAPGTRQATCCNAMGVLQGLGCFCDASTRDAARAAVTPDSLAAVAACQPSQNTDLDSRCGATFPGAVYVVGQPDVLSVPGLGFVNGGELARHLDSLRDQIAEAARDALPAATFPEEARPVLDLSDATRTDIGSSGLLSISADPDIQVLSSDVRVAGDDVFLSLDLDVPPQLLQDGLSLDLDVDEDGEALELVSLSLDVKLPDSEAAGTLRIDVDTESGPEDSVELELEAELGPEDDVEVELVSDGTFQDMLSLDIDIEDGLSLVLPAALASAAGDADAGTDVTVELDVDLPAEMMARLGVTDVSIEMAVDMDGSATVSETNITVEGEENGPPMTGRGLGVLLKDAAQFLFTVIPVPSPSAQPALVLAGGQGEQLEVSTILSSAVQMLAEVGDQILRTIPNTDLGDGKTIEILIEETTLPDNLGTARVSSTAAAAPMLAARRALDSLADAVRSAMYSTRAENETQQHAACSLCKYVRSHERLLWGIVHVNVALLALCGAALAIRALRRPASPTAPEGDLCEPLIVTAADYATPAELSSKAALSPAWAPPSKLPGL